MAARAATKASVLSVPDPFTSQQPRPPVSPPMVAGPKGLLGVIGPKELHHGGRACPMSYVQSREGDSLSFAAASPRSPDGVRLRRTTPRSVGKGGSVNIEIVPSPVGVTSSPRSSSSSGGGSRILTRLAAAAKQQVRIPHEEADATEDGW